MTILLLFSFFCKKKYNIKETSLKYIFLVLIAMLVSYSATSQVTADFTTINSTSGCGSLVVEFEDLSLGSPTSWLWDFGNGNTSVLKDPITIYSVPGIYDVTLKVSDALGDNVKTKYAYVKVYENPVAVFQASTAVEGCMPLNIDFEDLSTHTVPIVSWQWDFGDGGGSFVEDPSYNYLNNGDFSVSLSITDDNGCQSLVTDLELVTVHKVPVVDFESDIFFSCNSSESVSFTNNSMFSTNYQWDFGDGNVSSIANPTHMYNSGVYSVTLIAKEGNCSDTLVYNDYIKIGDSLTPNFIVNTNSGCEDLDVVFTDVTINNPDVWLWDFGDGTTSTNQNPSHTYINAGVYDITLTTSLSGQCLTSLVFPAKIDVFENPDVNFIADTTYACSAPFDVLFTDNTANVSKWLWDFGDGQTDSITNPLHSFVNYGSYDITLTVENLDGCSSSLSLLDLIKVDKIIVDFSASNLEGCAPYAIDFNDVTVSSRPLIDWSWDFGDGNFSNLQNPSNTYLNPGVFDVSLVVVNDYGCQSSFGFTDYIKADEAPLVDFTSSTVTSCAGQDINFTDLSSLGANNWQWSFGEGIFSNIQSPVYQYSLPGLYDVSLIAGVNSCRDTLVMSDYIKIIEPAAIFEVEYNCDNPLLVNFSNLSIGADLVNWDFGDGVSSNQLNPSHVFTTLGVHDVSLSVTNNITGCTHEFIKQIKLTEPVANFDYLINPTNGYQDSVGCAPKKVYIDNKSQDCAYYKVLWSDGYVGYGREDHTFTAEGDFDVTLIVTDIHGCKDTMMVESMYHIYDIEVDFGISNILGCDSMLVGFTDLTVPASSNLLWDFGDGESSLFNNSEHIYYNEGYYDVTVFGESSKGCKDTLKRLEYIKFQYPTANFSVSSQGICPGDDVFFTNLSNGFQINSVWDFGDGSQSSDVSPIHQFSYNGVYDINLMVTDSFGCSNSLNLNSHIEVQKPTADFTTPVLGSSCPPLISDFTNLSSNDASFFTWEFSDGGSSTIENPTHLFSNSGIFDVSLIVENSFGCQDTLVKLGLVNISGPIGSFIVSDSLVCKNQGVNFIPNLVNTSAYLWDFGDGFYSNDSFPTHEYAVAGNFIPTLIAESDSGCQITISLFDTIHVREVTVDAGSSDEICLGESIQLSATGSSTQFTWVPSATLSNPNIIDPVALPLTDVLYFVYHSDGICDAVDSVFIAVHSEVPEASFTTNNNCEGDITSFFANSGLNTVNVSYDWSFGQNGQNVNTSLNVGNNLIMLVVKNMNNSCIDSVIKSVQLFPLPVADFSASDACLGEDINFTDNSSINTVEWSYNFADGIGVSSDPSPSYLFPEVGVYNVTLRVTSNEGCENIVSKGVQVHELPLVDFIIENHCENQGNIFTDLSSVSNSQILGIQYDFNDGNISNDSISSHVFLGNGLFDVSLTAVTKNGCKSTLIKTAEVYAKPIVDFTISEFCLGSPTIFNDYSFVEGSGITNWNWIFGLESFSTNNNTVYTFKNDGIHYISLSVMSARGCQGLKEEKIIVNKLPEPVFEAPSYTCLGSEFSVSDMSDGNGADIIAWSYQFGDGSSSNEQNPDHTYHYIGEFDVSLEVVSQDGCIKDTIIPNMITVHSLPVADFQASALMVSEINSEISFYNHSEGATSYFWDFDDGDYSVEEDPVYDFRNTRDYNVSLTAVSDFGCESEIIKIINIYPEFTIFIPDAFTPDGDGINDVFEVQGNKIAEFEMQVFDRWGGVVFESKSIDLGWNGADYSGLLTDSGVYLYRITAHDLNGRIWVYNGELNLMR
tara:strand:+ start:21878 stop:27196 length:5319 start_codon:yes stop_codon:yes gene_type:complete